MTQLKQFNPLRQDFLKIQQAKITSESSLPLRFKFITSQFPVLYAESQH